MPKLIPVEKDKIITMDVQYLCKINGVAWSIGTFITRSDGICFTGYYTYYPPLSEITEIYRIDETN